MEDKVVNQMRPRSMAGVYGLEQYKVTWQEWMENKSMPDCIYVGPPGSGKTTSMLINVSEMFGGYDVWDGPNHPDFLMLNASDERGIDVVRGKIKEFASANQPKANVPFRIVVLEEGDQLTTDAQNALRHTIEQLSAFVRFIFLGNDETYIDAIKSRCAIFRFPALTAAECTGYFKKAAEKYGVKLGAGVAEAAGLFYEGDMRRMLNDCFEKIRFHKGVVEIKDLDFSSSVKATVNDILALLLAPGEAPAKYVNARKKFTSEHAKYHFDLRDFVSTLENTMGEMSFDFAEYFSTIDDRLRTSQRNKEVHVGALLAAIARGAVACNK
jgi:replication factor C small subunit